MNLETVLSLCLGLGLSAACGFRVFVPFLLMNLAARAGYLSLSGSFEWIGSTPALVMFAVATLLEIGAFYIPWLDNFLDSVSTPAAAIAGVVATASVVTGIDPMIKWPLAVIAGGGVAGAVQATTVAARAASTLGSGGLANPIVSSVETGSAIVLTFLAIVLPLLAVAAVILFFFALSRVVRRRRAA